MGWKTDTLVLAHGKIRQWHRWSGEAVLVEHLSDCRFSRVGDAMFGNGGAHVDGKRAEKSWIIHQRTFLEAMCLCLTEDTDGCNVGVVMGANFAYSKITEGVIFSAGESKGRVRVGVLRIIVEEFLDTTLVGVAMLGVVGWTRLGVIWWTRLGSSAVGRAMWEGCLLERTVRIRQVVGQGDGKVARGKQVSFGEVLAIKAGYLCEVSGVLA